MTDFRPNADLIDVWSANTDAPSVHPPAGYLAGFLVGHRAESREVRALRHISSPASRNYVRPLTFLARAAVTALGFAVLGAPVPSVAQRLVPVQLETDVSQADDGTGAVLVDVYLSEPRGLTGLALRVHFDTAVLALERLEDVLRVGKVAEQLQLDAHDFDGDPATDTFLNIAWMDNLRRWPTAQGTRASEGATDRHLLFRARFLRLAPDQTSLRLTSPALPPGRSLGATPVRIRQ